MRVWACKDGRSDSLVWVQRSVVEVRRYPPLRRLAQSLPYALSRAQCRYRPRLRRSPPLSAFELRPQQPSFFSTIETHTRYKKPNRHAATERGRLRTNPSLWTGFPVKRIVGTRTQQSRGTARRMRQSEAAARTALTPDRVAWDAMFLAILRVRWREPAADCRVTAMDSMDCSADRAGANEKESPRDRAPPTASHPLTANRVAAQRCSHEYT